MIASEKKLVKACLRGDSKMQYALYNEYAPKMMGVCLRYSNSQENANELLQTGFIKVFNKLDKFSFEGPLGGWIRKVIVNNALDQIKKTKRFQEVDIENHEDDFYIESEDDYNLLLDEETILDILGKLKEEHRVVFNLHCIEKYSHREISSILGIKEESSRSQLRRARLDVKRRIEKYLRNKNS